MGGPLTRGSTRLAGPLTAGPGCPHCSRSPHCLIPPPDPPHPPQLIPTSGSTSTSLWDTPDPAALLAWLEGAVAVDVAHSVHEVQEEFALGLGDVARARGADVVAAAGRDVADKTGRAVLDLDARLHLSEKAGRAADAVRDSAVTKSTVAALNKAGTRVADVTTRVLESDRVAAATDAMGAGFKKLGASFTRFVRPGEPAAAAGAGGDAVSMRCGMA